MEISLYIHIPFCKRKCNYCDFYSIVASENLISRYIDSLIQEMKIYSRKYDFKINTIYIGGGTPSILNPEYIRIIVKNIRKYFKSIPEPEFTIEANPESVNKEFLETLKKCGVNRLSMGIQSFNDKLLKIAGRLASREIIDEKINLVKKMNFINWSADLIYGLPYQHLKDFEYDLDTIINYNPSHISLYALTIEKGTNFFSLYREKQEIFPSDDEVSEMYFLANEFLEKNKYYRYEISNFAPKGYECKHNLAYWNLRDYLGLGASSVSTINSTRWKNVSDVNKYIKYLKENKLPLSNMTKLTKKEKIQEFIMLQLRLRKGLDLKILKQQYEIDLLKQKFSEIEEFIKAGLIKLQKNRIFLTIKGIIVSNSVISALI
ncbi:MAG TPA: radical SAM family heme chaperone HemW [Candidatus Atribacteria bacterium]|nr:radical SAM family heme chaperone HemW [Candidatus Atribacteria bacterium]